jgi:hypothetical protein
MTPPPDGTQGPQCQADMDTVNRLFTNIRNAIADVEKFCGPDTWGGPPADVWRQNDWGGPKGKINALMNNAEADEPSLVQMASQKPIVHVNPHLRGV